MKITLVTNKPTEHLGSFFDEIAQKDLAESLARSDVEFVAADVRCRDDLENVLANNSDLFWPNSYAVLDEVTGQEFWPVEIMQRQSLPFIGPGKDALIGFLQKDYCQQIMKSNDVPVPDFISFEHGEYALNKLGSLTYPLIVKPVAECASNGIYEDSICYTRADVLHNVKRVYETTTKGAIIEEFLAGTELTVGIISNGSEQIVVSGEYDLKGAGVELRSKDVKENKITKNFFSLIEDPVQKKKIADIAKKVYDASGTKEFTRFDCRYDSQGVLKVFDVNGMPGMALDGSVFPKYFYLDNPQLSRHEAYDALVNAIIIGSANRNGISVSSRVAQFNLFSSHYLTNR